MAESKVQKKIIDYLKKRGYYTIKTVRSNMVGVPDIIVCDNFGCFYAIEVKDVGKKNTVTKLQQHHIDTINVCGGVAFVADSVQDVIDKGL